MPGMVVGVDGSPNSVNALEWALGEAEARDAPLTVLAVNPVAIGLYGISPLHYPADEEDRKKVEQAVKDVVDQAVARSNCQASVSVRALSGVPSDELVKASASAELVVVGARGAGGFARLTLGSVSTQLAHHSACPLVIVPGDRGGA